MKASKEPIDYESLERELHEALRADELYNLQNDAKFRAIEQAVPTYEDFREMVNAAHLKPLDKKDMTPKVGVKWNSLASNTRSSLSYNQQLEKSFNQQSAIQISPFTIPKNSHEFRQIWKGLDHYRDKFQLLNDTRLALRNEIFRSEIPPDILTDCLITCLEILKCSENKILVTDILIAISECNRFNLAVAFMSEKEKSVCKELFQTLHNMPDMINENIVETLEKKYLH